MKAPTLKLSPRKLWLVGAAKDGRIVVVDINEWKRQREQRTRPTTKPAA